MHPYPGGSTWPTVNPHRLELARRYGGDSDRSGTANGDGARQVGGIGTPIDLGPSVIDSRIICTGRTPGFSPTGRVIEAWIAFTSRSAAAGIPLSTTGTTAVRPSIRRLDRRSSVELRRMIPNYELRDIKDGTAYLINVFNEQACNIEKASTIVTAPNPDQVLADRGISVTRMADLIAPRDIEKPSAKATLPGSSEHRAARTKFANQIGPETKPSGTTFTNRSVT